MAKRSDPFGAEAGPPLASFTHVQPTPERRTPAPGPAGAGDLRAQKGTGALAVLAENPMAENLGATITEGTTAATGAGQVGVHFTGSTVAEGFGAPPGAVAPTGFSPTSGPAPAQQGSRGWLEFGGTTVPSPAPPNASSAGGPAARL